jgi:hypothetical protein
MKLLYLSLILLLAFTSLQAAPVITLQTNNGDWRTNSSWNLNRIPQNGDTVVIPSGFTVYINDNIDMGSALLYIKIRGTLHFNGGGAKLILQENCSIMVLMNGRITSTTSPSQVIKIGTTTKYEGSGGTIVGPVIADRNSGAGFAAAEGVILPVQFLRFQAKRNESLISLEWTMVQEGLVDHFSVERSLTGHHWEVIANLAAINQAFNPTYQYTDKLPRQQSAHYRIRHTDKEGKKIYTPVQSVKGIGETMYPSIIIAKQKVSIYFPERSQTGVQLSIYTPDGKLVIGKALDRPQGEVIIHLPMKRHYIIQLKDRQQLHISRQIIL